MFTQYKYNNYKHTNIYKQFMHFMLYTYKQFCYIFRTDYTLFRALTLLYFLISVSINKITILCCTIKIVE